jgi:hypothetical protein
MTPCPSAKLVFQLMEDAVFLIDMKFGEGYAKNNPVLIAAFLSAFAIPKLAESASEMQANGELDDPRYS